MIILAIETSCDDTCAAIVESGPKGHWILSNIVSSQVKVHAPFGGVVPNLASREHLKNIKPCLKKALKESDKKPGDIDLIAVTIGPGLIPSLLVGVNFAKALAYSWQKPILGINHLEGHIYANWLGSSANWNFLRGIFGEQGADGAALVGVNGAAPAGAAPFTKKFPALCLIVSGGQTQLVLMKDHGKYKLLGETRDDAAGEAFDKVAKLLGLGYPGGPIVSKMAEKGNPKAIDFPRPMLNSQNYDFSFSGLKTAVLYLWRENTALVSDVCASFQQAVIDVLIAKTIRAAKECKTKTVMLSGGVAANQELRKQMAQAIKKETRALKFIDLSARPSTKICALVPNSEFYIPDTKFCTDNAAMIAAAAYYRANRNRSRHWSKIQTQANLPLS